MGYPGSQEITNLILNILQHIFVIPPVN